MVGERGKLVSAELTDEDAEKHTLTGLIEGGKRRITVGRDEDNDVVVGGITVSRCHAVLRYDSEKDAVYVSDLSSSNGIVVRNSEKRYKIHFPQIRDGEVVSGRVLVEGDRISIGANELRYSEVRE